MDLLCPITHIMYSAPPAHDAPASPIQRLFPKETELTHRFIL